MNANKAYHKSMKQENLNKIIELRHLLHSSPEISNHEIHTREIIKNFISENMPEYEIHDEGGWLYCLKDFKEGRKTIILRADHDAILNSNGIPFHGCGHDGHTAILLGAMLEAENVDKNVIYLFQAAEENGAGAPMCAPLFKKYKVDEVYGLHNMPGLKKNVVYYRPETVMCASVGYRISLKGVQSHASEPEKGLNPVYELARFAESIEPLSKFYGYKPFKFKDYSFTNLAMITIINLSVGSLNFGISPANGEISLTMRAAKENELKMLEEYVRRYFDNLKDKFEVHIEEFDRFDENYSDPELVEETIKRIGGLEYLPEPIRASEDFGFYKQFAPCMFFFVGMGDCPSLHNDLYKFDDDIIETGVELFKKICRLAI